jgi:hypothetical protein
MYATIRYSQGIEQVIVPMTGCPSPGGQIASINGLGLYASSLAQAL